ncbi:hypothetical protein [Pseudotabrizicola alkalilacus]|uniref:hypothetical protein n=1 Tax=Pseudotabrizicola alkalilacus TaxID=2305252 RepID=UPI000E49CB64|nr:hypothetical protein [Pseudotabrizicola alkalilacus]
MPPAIRHQSPKRHGKTFCPLPFGLIGTAIVGLIARTALGDALVRMRKCPTCGSRSLSRRRKVISRATTAQAGHGMMHTHCSSCGWDRSEPYRIAQRSSSNSSSGGFGGGSSSGGGATGRW